MHTVRNEDPILSSAETRLLVEVGLLAAGFRHPAAQRIFGGLRGLRPDLSAPLIGLAMYCIECGKAAEAVEILQRGIEDGLEKHNDLQAMLGVALIAAKRNHEAGRLLHRLVSREQGDSPEMRMAKGLVDHYVLSLALHPGVAMPSGSSIATPTN